jgi:hypothetical protein
VTPMSQAIAIKVDARAGLNRVSATFGRMPSAVDRAMARALRRLSTWIKRAALRAASKASGVPQKFFARAFRYHVDVTDEGLAVWIGTEAIAQHRLGKVVWHRGMRGARAGRRSFPGAWSWGPGSKTGPAIMRRLGTSRTPIAQVPREDIHPAVLTAMTRIEAQARARFDVLLAQQLNYALNVEGRR